MARYVSWSVSGIACNHGVEGTVKDGIESPSRRGMNECSQMRHMCRTGIEHADPIQHMYRGGWHYYMISFTLQYDMSDEDGWMDGWKLFVQILPTLPYRLFSVALYSTVPSWPAAA